MTATTESLSSRASQPSLRRCSTPQSTCLVRKIGVRQQPTSGSLLRAASLTSRLNRLNMNIRDQRQTPATQCAQDVSAEAGGAQPSPSAPSIVTSGSLRLHSGNASTATESPLITPRANATVRQENKAALSSRPAAPAPKSAFGRAAVGHQPRSPRSSVGAGGPAQRSPRDSTASVAAGEAGSAVPNSARGVSDKEADHVSAERERERVRAARAAFAAQRQHTEEQLRTRDEEQRRRTAVLRDRARADREAARSIARTPRLSSAVSAQALEEGWVVR